MQPLSERHCRPLDSSHPPLSAQQANELLAQLDDDWLICQDNRQLTRVCSFKNYYQTMAFVNAVAWIAHQQDHHPDLVVSYNKCVIHFSTHSIGGLSDNDFICAARIDLLCNNG